MSATGQIPLLNAAKIVGLGDETLGAVQAANQVRKEPSGEEGVLRPLPEVPWERMKGERSDAFMAFTHPHNQKLRS